MKFSDILKAKDLFASLPHTLLAWISTALTIGFLISLWFFINKIYDNWQQEKQNEIQSDSIIINSVAQLQIQLNKVDIKLNAKIDSMGRALHSLDILNQEKINSLAIHVQYLEKDNYEIMRDLNNIDSNFKLFTSPFIYYQKQNESYPMPSICNYGSER